MPNQINRGGYYIDPEGVISVKTGKEVPWGVYQVLFWVSGGHLYIQADSRYGWPSVTTGMTGLLCLIPECVYLYPNLEKAVFDDPTLSKQMIEGLKKIIGLTIAATPYILDGGRPSSSVNVQYTADTIVRPNTGRKILGTLSTLGAPPIETPIANAPQLRFGELDRRAQADNKRLFIEDLYNLKSSIADILRDDERNLQSDIEKLSVDHAKLVRQEPRIADLGIAQALKGMSELAGETFSTQIDKYKRYNNFYNEQIVKPIKENLPLWGVRIDPSTLESGPLSETIVQPKTVSLIPKIPQYLKLQKNIPEISKGKPSKSWHDKLDDVTEMLKVLGRYVPMFDKLLQTFDWIDQDSRSLIDLQSNTLVNSHIAGANDFYELCAQIASRMKTAKLIAVRGRNHVYVLEEMPSVYRFSPTANRELIDILWKDYVKSGTVDDLATRMQQLVEERATLQKKFKQVFQQWSLLYTDTAKRVGVEAIQPIELQLVRYGQQIVSQRDLAESLQAIAFELDNLVEETRELAAQFANLRITIEGSVRESLGGQEFPQLKKVAQLREPTEAPVKLEIPEEYGPAPEIPPVEVKPARPPKLPISEEFLPLLSDYDLNLYYSQDERLTPPQAISMAGRNELLIAMTYQKAAGTGDPEEMVIKNYTLEPYSYRYRRTKHRGQRKYFFGFDRIDNTIKAFLVQGIKAVQILPESFAPRWEVEFR